MRGCLKAESDQGPVRDALLYLGQRGPRLFSRASFLEHLISGRAGPLLKRKKKDENHKNNWRRTRDANLLARFTARMYSALATCISSSRTSSLFA